MGLVNGASGKVSLAKWQLVGLLGAAGLATGATGMMIWKVTATRVTPAMPTVTADETRLLAKAQEAQQRRQTEAKKLKQAEVGTGYQVDPEGNLTGPTDNSDLPADKSLDEIGVGSASVHAEIARGIHVGKGDPGPGEEDYGIAALGRGHDGDEAGKDGKVQRAELEKSMLGYSTVKAAKWAAIKPEAGEADETSKKSVAAKAPSSTERAIGAIEERLASLPNTTPTGSGAGPGATAGMWAGVTAGPSKGGADLMPAEEQAQAFVAGTVGDMRIGGDVGPDQIVRQGKFLDCVVVNEVRADLMESPVIGMVSRDFVSLDGEYVLVPAGSKLIGSAGRVQNLQQARVYIRFDRVIFPDQRSAYFPLRRLAALDGAGAVGVEGDVDRHFMLMFGSAVMLGLLDGLAAAVEGAQSSATPTARELIAARTSMNLSQVVSGILARYGNVVPTITVETGSKMKVFFAEDVRMTPYMRSRDLTWVKRGALR